MITNHTEPLSQCEMLHLAFKATLCSFSELSGQASLVALKVQSAEVSRKKGIAMSGEAIVGRSCSSL